MLEPVMCRQEIAIASSKLLRFDYGTVKIWIRLETSFSSLELLVPAYGVAEELMRR